VEIFGFFCISSDQIYTLLKKKKNYQSTQQEEVADKKKSLSKNVRVSKPPRKTTGAPF